MKVKAFQNILNILTRLPSQQSLTCCIKRIHQSIIDLVASWYFFILKMTYDNRTCIFLARRTPKARENKPTNFVTPKII